MQHGRFTHDAPPLDELIPAYDSQQEQQDALAKVLDGLIHEALSQNYAYNQMTVVISASLAARVGVTGAARYDGVPIRLVEEPDLVAVEVKEPRPPRFAAGDKVFVSPRGYPYTLEARVERVTIDPLDWAYGLSFPAGYENFESWWFGEHELKEGWMQDATD